MYVTARGGDKLRAGRRTYTTAALATSPDMREQFQGDEAAADKDNDNEEEGDLVIDDQPEDVEEEKTPADLASISNLLTTANNQT